MMTTARPFTHAFTLTMFLGAGLAVGCGGDTTPEVTEIPAEEVPAPANVPAAQEMTVNGCLRAGDTAGTFVLAALPADMGASADRATRGAVATYTYLLVGEGLAQHVGRQVTVRGIADDAADVDVNATSESEGPTTTVNGEKVTPSVEVEEEAVIDVRRMRVSSVEPTGEACATGS